jgi:hypothetical protein
MDRRLGLVKYLGKYLAKGFAEGDRELNGHRFRASLGIKVPTESLTVPPNERGNVGGFVCSELTKRAGRLGHVWDDPTKQAGWACSW